jgi:hypothetical protein
LKEFRMKNKFKTKMNGYGVLLVGLLFSANTFALDAPAALVPPGLGKFDQFYVVYVSSAGIAGNSTAVQLDTFATTSAALDPDTASIAGWKTLYAHDDASITTTTAFTGGLLFPIYTTLGVLVANNRADMFDGTLIAAINNDEAGAVVGGVDVWTGFDSSGVTKTVNEDTLGGTDTSTDGCTAGINNSSTATWADNGVTDPLNSCAALNRVYIISPILTVPFTGVPASAAQW